MTTTAFLRVPVLLPALSARSFVFFSAGGVEACARCACLLSNEMQRERERKEVFRLGKYDRQKKEIVREKNFYFRTREEKESSFFGPSLVRISYSATRASSLSLEGGFPSLSTTAVITALFTQLDIFHENVHHFS